MKAARKLIDAVTNITSLLRGDYAILYGDRSIRSIALYLFVIIVCCGGYGFTVGLWRSLEQGMYVALKFPLLIILTVTGTTIINWMLSQVIGLHITLRQSVLMMLSSYTIASVILASFIPISLFLLYNTPTIESDIVIAYNVYVLAHVGIIAFVGIVSVSRLYKSLFVLGTKRIASAILAIWLLISLFVGAQLSWNLRPFFGNPKSRVQFLRPDALDGNFYISVYHLVTTIIDTH